MIFELIAQLGVVMGQWVLGLLPPTQTGADLVVTAGNVFGPIVSGGAALGSWLPWAALGVVFPIVIGFYILAFLVKVARQLATHLPFIGGTG